VNRKIDISSLELEESIISISRVSKTVKGGKNFKLRVIAVVGDRKGYIGIGMGKAKERMDATRKAIEDARKNIVEVNIVNGTIPHEITGKYSASRVLMKPASKGTGVIANTRIKPLLELAGIENILTKSLGSNTDINIIQATFEGLKSLRRKESVYKLLNS